MLYIFLLFLLIVVSLALVGVVLIQSGKGSGLSGAFGLGEGQAVFGSRAGDILTKATRHFAIAFMVLCALVAWQSKRTEDSILSAARGGSVMPVRRSAGSLPTLDQLEKQAAATNALSGAEPAGAVGGTGQPDAAGAAAGTAVDEAAATDAAADTAAQTDEPAAQQ